MNKKERVEEIPSSIEYTKRKKCCICGESKFIKEASIEDFEFKTCKYDLLKCEKCGMYYTSPYPTDATLPNLYELRNSKNFDTKSLCIIDYLKTYLASKKIKSLIKGYDNPNISIAGFGCGNGRFALSFKRILPAAEVTAIDFCKTSPFTNLSIHKNFIPNYIVTKDFWERSEKYDIILLRHVVEHVTNPKDFFVAILTKLNDNGYIYVEVPNIKNGLALLFNKWLPSYYPPYHVVHFTKQNMEYLLRELNVDYELSYEEMPLMSNLIANMFHQKLNNFHRILGILLHPLQLLMCINQKTVLTVKIKKTSS